MEYGLIGEKLGHSFSKVIHTELCGYDYELCELTPPQLMRFMSERKFKAVNVTIPYKKAVLPYLDVIDGRAQKIGAVNTVVNRNGRLFGYNTDFDGLKMLIQKNGIELIGKKTVIPGSGGTSETALAVAGELGCKEVVRVSRKPADGFITYDELYTSHSDTNVIINTTPCGMYPNTDMSAVDISRFSDLAAVIDAVYNPLRTKLVMTAKERGLTATGGLYMLVCQAAAAARHFTGMDIGQAEIDRVYNKLVFEKENIVLIGMPGSGKSTLGTLIANQLGREFYDIDTLIEQKANMPIPEIFRKSGEAAFRKLESGVIADISKESGCVIATGGGAVLKNANVRSLKQNGRLILLGRDIESICVTESRPLSDSREKLMRLYNERMPIYTACADLTVKIEGSAQHCAQKIIKELMP